MPSLPREDLDKWVEQWLEANRECERKGDWKPLVFIILANLVFGILLAGLPSIKLPAMGMIVAIYALVFISSMAEAGWKVKNTFILATVLAIGSYLAFVVLLKLQFPVWPFFIG